MDGTQPKTENEDHLPPEILAAYSEDRLSATETEAVRRHLAACPFCADAVLELMAIDEIVEEGAPMERERAWRTLATSLKEAGLLPPEEKASRPARPLRMSPAAWRSWALAASLALALTGAWSLSLQRQLERVRAPQIDPPLASLMPRDELRTSSPEEPDRLVLRPGERGWLVLSHSEPEPPPRLRVSFRALPGGTAWQTEMPAADRRSVRLELTLDLVPPGSYEVELDRPESGARGGSWRTFATYRLDVVAAPAD